MKKLWHMVWNTRPVVFVGSLVSAWMAVVAFDQGDDSWEIPIAIYITVVPVMAFLTGITRNQVAAPGKKTETPEA